MSSTKIYLIPHWVTDTFKRHKLDTSSILDFKLVRQYLSLNDIAGILALRHFDDFIIDIKNSDFSSNISYEWSVSATPKDMSFLDDQVGPLANSESIKEMVNSRLFSDENAANNQTLDSVYSDTSDETKPYTIVHLSNNSLGIVFKAHGFTSSTARKYRLTLIRDILKQLYVYESQSSVAKTPAYLRYLQLLSEN